MRSAARQFGISDVALAKACRRHHIPVPGRGYWAQRAAGKAPRRARLPVVTDLERQSLAEIHFVGRRDHEVAREAETPAPAALQIVVPEELANPLPLIRRTRAALRRGTTHSGVLRAAEQPCLDIQVTKASLDRALRIANALLRACGELGFGVAIAEQAPHLTFVTVREERISLRIEEKIERMLKPPVKRPRHDPFLTPTYTYPDYEYSGTGVLSVRIFGVDRSGLRQSWRDGKKQRVEHCLGEVLAALEVAAQQLKQNRLEQEIRRREWEEAEQRRIDEWRREQEEKRRRQELEDLASSRERSVRILELLKALRSTALANDASVEPGSTLGAWLAWAEDYAERLDPVEEILSRFSESSVKDAQRIVIAPASDVAADG